MSRRKAHFVLAALAIAGGLALAPPNAAAAGGAAAQEPGLWSLALQWVAQVWEENVVQVLEMEGGLNGAQPATPPEGAAGDQGWGWDPNG